MTLKPVPMRWDGEVMRPLPRFARHCDEQFTVGENYVITVEGERSYRSHNHFFATIDDYWQNLPERYGDRFPTPKHLRKWCLIKAGYRNEVTHVCGSPAEAARLAREMKPIDEFAVILTRENTVIFMQAKSQKKNAMKPEEFQASKTAVLDILKDMVETEAA